MFFIVTIVEIQMNNLDIYVSTRSSGLKLFVHTFRQSDCFNAIRCHSAVSQKSVTQNYKQR